MSLLWMDYETEFQELVNTANRMEQEKNPEYFSELCERVKKIIYCDTRYNVDFLYTAYILKDSKIMEDYAVWLYQLMASVLKHKTKEETAEYVIRHLEYIRCSIGITVGMEKQHDLTELIVRSQKCIREQVLKEQKELQAENSTKNSKYETEIEEYMEALLEKNTRKVLQLVQEFTRRGIAATTIYVEILAESMRRVGDLWHTAQISVDTEHYCTSVTQLAMAQMYPSLFSETRKNRTILCACPGTELHEIGARMVADVFENDGWDSLFLGAAVPEDALLASIRENHPDVVALSVTMPQHLLVCADLVKAIRKEFPEVKIAVGGGAFKSTNQIWKQWSVDFYTEDARELLEKANAAMEEKEILQSHKKDNR